MLRKFFFSLVRVGELLSNRRNYEPVCDSYIAQKIGHKKLTQANIKFMLEAETERHRMDVERSDDSHTSTHQLLYNRCCVLVVGCCCLLHSVNGPLFCSVLCVYLLVCKRNIVVISNSC